MKLLALFMPAILFAQTVPTVPLPDKSISIHADTSPYEAVFAVAKMLGVDVLYVAGLKSDPIRLDLENVTGIKAFDTITAQANKLWDARPSPYKRGHILVIITDPPPTQHPKRHQ
jgi:hypothetical protein